MLCQDFSTHKITICGIVATISRMIPAEARQDALK
jgi:hypothetical protein